MTGSDETNGVCPDPAHHEPARVIGAVEVVFQCPRCDLDLEEETYVEDDAGLWHPADGGFRQCGACDVLIALPTLGLDAFGEAAHG